jgi:hypothetical protein
MERTQEERFGADFDCGISSNPNPDAHPPEDQLKHDPEKWTPVFGKRSCFNNKLERDDDSKKSHPALACSLSVELTFARLTRRSLDRLDD